MDFSLSQQLREEIMHRFGDRHPEAGEGDRVATFRCPSGAIGDVVVDVDGSGVIVEIVEMTHGHFDDGGPDEVVETCTEFLNDLFHDEVVVWSAAGGRSGGWFYRSHRSDDVPPEGARAGIWSGPWIDEMDE